MIIHLRPASCFWGTEFSLWFEFVLYFVIDFIFPKLLELYKICQKFNKDWNKALDERQDRGPFYSDWQVVYCCSELQLASLIIITTSLMETVVTCLQMIMMRALLHQKRPMNLVGVYQQQQTVTGLQGLFTSHCLVIIYFFDRSTE